MNQDTKVHETINSFPLEENVCPDCENPASILPYSTRTFLALDTVDLLQLIRGLQDRCDRQDAEIASLKEMLSSEVERVCIELVTDRKRIVALERHPDKQPATEKTTDHLDVLQLYLRSIKRTGAYVAVDFKEAARVLKLSKRRLLQLRPTIEADNRFTIQKRSGKNYICLGYKTR